MDACDATFSATYVLNEQIARAVFEMLPDGGPVVGIMDGDGHRWLSDPVGYDQADVTESIVDDLRCQVDDGIEPVTARRGDVSVTVTQLTTEHTRCGYLILVVPSSAGGMTTAQHDLVEALLGQILLVANLIEARCLLSDTQVRCYGAYGTSSTPVN